MPTLLNYKKTMLHFSIGLLKQEYSILKNLNTLLNLRNSRHLTLSKNALDIKKSQKKLQHKKLVKIVLFWLHSFKEKIYFLVFPSGEYNKQLKFNSTAVVTHACIFTYFYMYLQHTSKNPRELAQTSLGLKLEFCGAACD